LSHNDWKSMPLSRDHKPSLMIERQRIIDYGGRIERQKDTLGRHVGPERVWMANIDLPGLAMTRSFGDEAGIKSGVVCDPGNKNS
jgi:serine/threonine protein phosphatase PrpC